MARRDRVMVTAAGVLPDFDGLGIIVDKLNGLLGRESTFYYIEYHHILGHNIVFALLCASIMAMFSVAHKKAVFLLSLFAVHLHILCDVAGSKGPDGYQWPIYYLNPFDPSYELTWSGQWMLHSPINSAIGVATFALAFWVALRNAVTPFELFSLKMDRAAVAMGEKYGWIKSKAKKNRND
ncbi:MAG: metal-dependent hydrolase [Methylococcales bacterium]|nr:metal-dependent hydrolase [Methylococcales bacterium]MBT7445889.1 metal-dependent hydrolase [Methylococcales bacterium]